MAQARREGHGAAYLVEGDVACDALCGLLGLGIGPGGDKHGAGALGYNGTHQAMSFTVVPPTVAL